MPFAPETHTYTHIHKHEHTSERVKITEVTFVNPLGILSHGYIPPGWINTGALTQLVSMFLMRPLNPDEPKIMPLEPVISLIYYFLSPKSTPT